MIVAYTLYFVTNNNYSRFYAIVYPSKKVIFFKNSIPQEGGNYNEGFGIY